MGVTPLGLWPVPGALRCPCGDSVGASQRLLGADECGGTLSQLERGSSETRAVPWPLYVLQAQQSFSCLSHSVAWAGAECPGDCRDPWDQAKAPQGCSWCHTRDVCVLGTRSRAFPAAAKEGLPAEHQGTAWGAPTCCVWLSPCLCSDSNPAAEGQGAGHVPGAGQHLIPGLLRTGHEGSWLSLRQPHRYGGAQRGSFKGLTETAQTKAR